MERLQHKCSRLRLLATCSITIRNKQNHNEIDCDHIVSYHDYNGDYICLLKHPQKESKPHLHGFMYVYFQTTFDINQRNK